jgi:hypothetical protein
LARLISWIIVVLAFLGVASLVGLPLLADEAAKRIVISRPDALPPKPQIHDEKRKEPLVPVSELHEALRLPKVDTALTDEHSRASLSAYRANDYERAFEEAVLALDPTPLSKNELYQVLTTLNENSWYPRTQKPTGRPAIRSIDETLHSVLNTKD